MYFYGDGSTTSFTVPAYNTVTSIVSVAIDGVETSDYTFENNVLTLTTAPVLNAAIYFKYNGYGSNATGDLVIVGNGSSDSNRSNAYQLDKQGNGWFSGVNRIFPHEEEIHGKTS